MRSNRLLLFIAAVLFCLGLLFFGALGATAPAEGLFAVPLQFVQRIVNQVIQGGTGTLEDLVTMQTLRDRNHELEAALTAYQAELVSLREIARDYDNLAALLNYTRSRQDEEYLAADVIGRDISGFRRVIFINRGARDGITEGMPVVTDQGLVGRVTQVSATAAQVLLITDTISAVSALVQRSRIEGSIIGQLTGTLRMTFLDLGGDIVEGDTIITSGLGGNLPEGILIGQVTSIRQQETALFQEAEVHSLNDFEQLEVVLVITNFQPVDLSVFEPLSDETTGVTSP